MTDNNPAEKPKSRRAASVPLTLDQVLSEVVRILDEERAATSTTSRERLAA